MLIVFGSTHSESADLTAQGCSEILKILFSICIDAKILVDFAGVKVDPNQVFTMPAAMTAPCAAPQASVPAQPVTLPQPTPQAQPAVTDDTTFTIPQTITTATTSPASVDTSVGGCVVWDGCLFHFCDRYSV